ncbi:hypothetical protein U1Q18_025832 [Sarracenia purpurea var. burkii]
MENVRVTKINESGPSRAHILTPIEKVFEKVGKVALTLSRNGISPLTSALRVNIETRMEEDMNKLEQSEEIQGTKEVSDKARVYASRRGKNHQLNLAKSLRRLKRKKLRIMTKTTKIKKKERLKM